MSPEPTTPAVYGRHILDLPMAADNDAGAATIGEYLIALLRKLWTDVDDFSGKRPFGNSGWDFDLYVPLMNASLISGTLDEWGGVDSIDEAEGDRLIRLAIDTLGQRPGDGT